VLLSVTQLVMSAAGALFAVVMLLGASLTCTEAADCETERVHRFDHQTHTEVAVLGGGIAVALLLAGVGIAVAARRRSLMWIWPALGLGVVIVSYCVSAGMWLDSLSNMH
jgi:Zn-dependent protease with chaperone function